MPFTTADLIHAMTNYKNYELQAFWSENPECVNAFPADCPADLKGTSPLLYALRKKLMWVIRDGAKVPGCNLNVVDANNETLLSVAIDQGNRDFVIELVKLNVNLDIPNDSLLFYTAEKKQFKILFYFLDNGITEGINFVTQDGKTLFSELADAQLWYPLSKALSPICADINAGGHGKRILYLAALHGRVDVMSAISKNNRFSINTKLDNNETVFSIALKQRDIPMLKLLVQDASLDISGWSPQYLFTQLMDITAIENLKAPDALFFLKQVGEPNSVLNKLFWTPSLSWFSRAPSENHGVLLQVKNMKSKIEEYCAPAHNSEVSRNGNLQADASRFYDANL